MSENFESLWCIDSGCFEHLCNDLSLFSSYKHIEPIILTVGNSNKMSVDIVGNVNLISVCDDVKNVLCLSSVYYAPLVPYNLLSVYRIKNVLHTYFSTDGFCTIFIKNNNGSINNILKVNGNINDGYFVNLPVASEEDVQDAESVDIACLVVKNKNKKESENKNNKKANNKNYEENKLKNKFE